METEESIEFSEPRRQSMWAPIFIAGRLIRQIGIGNIAIAVVALVSGAVPRFLIAVVFLAAIGVAAVSLAQWWRRTFFVSGGELVEMKGLVNLKRVTIPLDRIQSVNLDQQLLHRPIGLVRARIETAGSAHAEFRFEALDRSVAEALRRRIVAAGGGRGSPAASPPGDPSAAAGVDPASAGSRDTGSRDAGSEDAGSRDAGSEGAGSRDVGSQGVVVLRRTPRDLLRVAVSGNPLRDLVVVGPLYLVASEVADQFELTWDEAFARVFGDSPGAAWVVPLVMLLVASWIGSTFLRYHDLTLWREGDRLRGTAGLANTRERSSSFDRIQEFRSSRNPLQRRWGIGEVVLPTAGGRGQDDRLTLPGTTRAEEQALLAMLLPTDLPTSHSGISPKATARWILWLGVVPAVVAGTGAAFVVGWWVVAAVAWPAVVAAVAPRVRRSWSVGLTSEVLEVRHGWMIDRAVRVAVRKAQAVTVRRMWFHRRHGLATMAVHTAAGRIVVPHVDVDVAYRMRDIILHRTQTDHRPWM